MSWAGLAQGCSGGCCCQLIPFSLPFLLQPLEFWVFAKTPVPLARQSLNLAPVEQMFAAEGVPHATGVLVSSG